MLHRVIIASETVGSAGESTLSLAQILGVSERNNRRDEITSVLMMLDGHCLLAAEGRRADLDRLIARLCEDRRLRNTRVVGDRPITDRSFAEPMMFCSDPIRALRAVGRPGLGDVTGQDAEHLVELKHAA